jgi:enterochelin esterase-like enzyme
VIGVIVSLVAGCAHKQINERSDYGQLDSAAMQKSMPYSVYTPPNWSQDESLPMLVLLHGARDNYRTFDRYEIGQYLDRLYATEAIPRALILNPEGDLGFWENWHDGSRLYRDWVIKELMPEVSKQYNALACPEHCYVTGMSMGGHGVLSFANFSPETFASFAAISSVIISEKNPMKPTLGTRLMRLFVPMERIWGDFDETAELRRARDPYVSWLNNPALSERRLMLSWGEKEGSSLKLSNQQFSDYLNANDRAHYICEYAGEHLWVDWRRPIAQSLRFHIWGENPDHSSFSTQAQLPLDANLLGEPPCIEAKPET